MLLLLLLRRLLLLLKESAETIIESNKIESNAALAHLFCSSGTRDGLEPERLRNRREEERG